METRPSEVAVLQRVVLAIVERQKPVEELDSEAKRLLA
jgi:hypothetical protein